jgi:hypothetical protein
VLIKKNWCFIFSLLYISAGSIISLKTYPPLLWGYYGGKAKEFYRSNVLSPSY